MESYDCLIVGGGPAGIGIGCVLRDLQVSRFLILEQDEVGASFELWPEEMRMITPSFTSNAYGMTDLNAIALKTSPAYTLGTEHPTGAEYADYLHAVVEHYELPVRTDVEVYEVRPLSEGGFELETSQGAMRSRFVIWAAGEFQYPRLNAFPGAEYALHNSLITSWREVEGEEIVVIGGYESGADAAIHLARLGKRVKLIDRNVRWTEKGSSDPSVELSPYTKDRLKQVEDGQIELLAGCEVHWIEETDEGYLIYGEFGDGQSLFIRSASRPILATGFAGSLRRIAPLFAADDHGGVLLTQQDESTLTPGLFVCGPSVRHGQLLFCFIYKFRQRFGVVGERIAQQLGLSLEPLDAYRREGFFLNDLSCCGEDCAC